MIRYWILDDQQQPVEVHDSVEWGRWFSNNQAKRRLARHEIGGYIISTVFLGLDHNFSGKGPPLLWETLVGYYEMTHLGRGLHDEEMYRYSNPEAALKKHHEIVDRIAARAKVGEDMLTEILK